MEAQPFCQSPPYDQHSFSPLHRSAFFDHTETELQFGSGPEYLRQSAPARLRGKFRVPAYFTAVLKIISHMLRHDDLNDVRKRLEFTKQYLPNIISSCSFLRHMNEVCLVSPIELYEGVFVEDFCQQLKRLSQCIQLPNGTTQSGFAYAFDFIENVSQDYVTHEQLRLARSPINACRNRYRNVLPFENSRVRLRDGEHGNDYINANWIGTVTSPKRYIATQGPLLETIPHMWSMIWHENISVIVMLTKTVENGRVKCSQYWPFRRWRKTSNMSDEPDHLSEIYGNFEVVLADEDEKTLADCIIRKLVVRNLLDSTQPPRLVWQFHFTGWPDHGIPTSCQSFLQMMSEADRRNQAFSPLLVHCSAGIGRTGTFCTVHATIEKIALDWLLSTKSEASVSDDGFPRKRLRSLDRDPFSDQYLFEPPNNVPVSVLATALSLRRQRPGMVQNKDQLEFCYSAIKEALFAKVDGFRQQPLSSTFLAIPLSQHFASPNPVSTHVLDRNIQDDDDDDDDDTEIVYKSTGPVDGPMLQVPKFTNSAETNISDFSNTSSPDRNTRRFLTKSTQFLSEEEDDSSDVEFVMYDINDDDDDDDGIEIVTRPLSPGHNLVSSYSEIIDSNSAEINASMQVDVPQSFNFARPNIYSSQES